MKLEDMQSVVFEIVAMIPEGKVATYKTIARLSGVKNPRNIGSILHRNTDPERVPCHRVVNARGRMAPSYAFGGSGKQAERLKAEGVAVDSGYTDLAVYGWDG